MTEWGGRVSEARERYWAQQMLNHVAEPTVFERLFPPPPPTPLTLGQRVRRRLRTFSERIQACREILAGKHDDLLPLDHSE